MIRWIVVPFLSVFTHYKSVFLRTRFSHEEEIQFTFRVILVRGFHIGCVVRTLQFKSIQFEQCKHIGTIFWIAIHIT